MKFIHFKNSSNLSSKQYFFKKIKLPFKIILSQHILSFKLNIYKSNYNRHVEEGKKTPNRLLLLQHFGQ